MTSGEAADIRIAAAGALPSPPVREVLVEPLRESRSLTVLELSRLFRFALPSC